MKLLQKIAEWFSRKTAAQTSEEDEKQVIRYPVQPVQSVQPIKDTTSMGVCNKAYSPKIFAQWLSMHLEKKISSSAIETTNFYTNDENKKYILTAFTYNVGKYTFWVQIGTWNIYQSLTASLVCEACSSFRLMLKGESAFQYVGICERDNERIIIKEIVRGFVYSPSDDETKVKCPILPCDIDSALAFIEPTP